MSRQTMSKDLSSVTFSQASAAGLTDSGWLAGPTTDQSGREAVLASHSVLPAKVAALQTNAIYGPLFGGSSPSADLQRSLASRLRAAMDVHGSPEYVLTWKSWDIGAEPPICALRASARHTSDNGSGGWRTPTATDGDHGGANARDSSGSPHLTAQAASAGWPTPVVKDASEVRIERPKCKGNFSKHPGLAIEAQSAGWPTPISHDAIVSTFSQDRIEASVIDRQDSLNRAAQLTGPQQSGTNAATESSDGYRLNPSFSLWLMGYPAAAWACCGARAMQSYRSVPKRS